MKYDKTTTKYNCGIDLHTKQTYICVMDREHNILVHKNGKGNDFAFSLKLAEAYRHDLTVVCECCYFRASRTSAATDGSAKALWLHPPSGPRSSYPPLPLPLDYCILPSDLKNDPPFVLDLLSRET